MLNNVNTNVEHIIAKIDNDFNPDNSDWIPRVGAWCIDAMAQLDVTIKEIAKKKYKVIDRIVRLICPIGYNFNVYDKNGCKIDEASSKDCSCNVPSTGKSSQSSCSVTANTISRVNTGNKKAPDYVIATTKPGFDLNDNYVEHYTLGDNNINKNYVIVDCNTIELNFDANEIIVEQEVIKTYYSDYFKCELPVIPNNGLLIEAIAYYCVYKMLCRGYKHPVFNLSASQYGTNPYYMWNTIKEEAKRSVIIDGINDNIEHIMRSNFFVQTFDTRH